MATESVLEEGDAGYAPRGAGHYFINTNETHDAYVILMFSDGEFTNVDVAALTANVPPQVICTGIVHAKCGQQGQVPSWACMLDSSGCRAGHLPGFNSISSLC